MAKKQYVFRDNQTHEIAIFTRIKGEYLQVSDEHCLNNSRLYSFLRITSLADLVAEMLQLDWQLIAIRF